jgi:hypothetical protein
MAQLEPWRSSISLQPFGHLRSWISARPGLLRLGAASILFAVLLAPSIWMLSVIPPLWRDVDAYVQVTYPPGPGTILQYGPLYCFVARIPLYLGCAMDCLIAGSPLPTLRFFTHPILTDSGVFALLISQHVALCCATFYLITLTSPLFGVRITLAIVWAANPLFYMFAHTVGSETLSMILLLLLGAVGLRIVQDRRNASWKRWLFFSVLLWFCILARHINAALAALLPSSFILVGAYRLIVVPLINFHPVDPRRWSEAKQALQRATLAVVVGISCILLANASVRILCYAARTPYYSTLGFTFLFRLKFLAELSPEKRNQLLDDVTNHTASPAVKEMISLIRAAFSTETSNWDVPGFNQKARASLFTRQTDPDGGKYAVLLNHTALAFLSLPEKIFLSTIAADFKRSQEITIPNVVSFLFVTTRFYFSHRAVMPQCASLVTFRDTNASEVFAIFKNHSYFRHPKNASHRALLLFWLVVLALFLLIAKIRMREAAGLASYATALMVIGLLMMLANCALTVFQPRFTLPMWELTIISVSILSGKAMEYMLAGAEQQQKLVPC